MVVNKINCRSFFDCRSASMSVSMSGVRVRVRVHVLLFHAPGYRHCTTYNRTYNRNGFLQICDSFHEADDLSRSTFLTQAIPPSYRLWDGRGFDTPFIKIPCSAVTRLARRVLLLQLFILTHCQVSYIYIDLPLCPAPSTKKGLATVCMWSCPLRQDLGAANQIVDLLNVIINPRISCWYRLSS